eukprot:scaffold42856_cov87-Phaeocystis_antarctica.AAC.4
MTYENKRATNEYALDHSCCGRTCAQERGVEPLGYAVRVRPRIAGARHPAAPRAGCWARAASAASPPRRGARGQPP